MLSPGSFFPLLRRPGENNRIFLPLRRCSAVSTQMNLLHNPLLFMEIRHPQVFISPEWQAVCCIRSWKSSAEMRKTADNQSIIGFCMEQGLIT
jgi:hypothetical protein